MLQQFVAWNTTFKVTIIESSSTKSYTTYLYNRFVRKFLAAGEKLISNGFWDIILNFCRMFEAKMMKIAKGVITLQHSIIVRCRKTANEESK